MLIKGVTEIAKMLNGMLELKSEAASNKNQDDVVETISGKVDKLIDRGMSAIEMMSYANYEINLRRRECIKPDLNEDYTSLFSSSVPINNFLFGGDTYSSLRQRPFLGKRSHPSQEKYPRRWGRGRQK